MDNQDNYIIQQEQEINGKLHINILTLNDLKAYIKLKYRTYKEAGQDVGLSKDRVRQIINGFRCPKTPQLINQIAKGWDIDSIKLTLIFSDCNNKQQFKTPIEEIKNAVCRDNPSLKICKDCEEKNE